MMERVRIVFSGSGGQGVITAGIVLAEAAVLHENLLATQTQSYGPEARGGATRCDVIISDTEIFFPKVIQPNVLVCLTQEAYMKYHDMVRPGGLIITDSRHVTVLHSVDSRQVELPIHHTVMECMGNAKSYNVSVLGAVLGLRDIVKPESALHVLETKFPGVDPEFNRKALYLGMDLGKKNGI
jgi:2-oxoglutarate ferredoxin oxidoreductase subunit gamma